VTPFETQNTVILKPPSLGHFYFCRIFGFGW